MDSPPFLTFSSIVVADTKELCYACSLTHAQCEKLINNLMTVVARGENEGAGREVRLRRLWPFFKALSENEIACVKCYMSHPSWPRSNQRTLMRPLRAIRWKTLASEIIQEALGQHLNANESIRQAFATVLPAHTGGSRGSNEVGEVCMEWKHWIKLLSSFRIIAQIHPLYQNAYLYEGPTL